MNSSTVKTLALVIAAGGAALGLGPAQALPGLDRATAPSPSVEKVGCGPWGCAPGWGGGYGYRGYGGYGGYRGYGYRPHPRPYGYYGGGYGYGRPRPWGWGPRHYWGGPGWGRHW